MKQFNSFTLILTLVLLFLVPNLAAASLDPKTAEIPYQIKNSDRIVIGTVSEIKPYSAYTIYTITVKEWLYSPLPVDTIKVETKIGTNVSVEDEAEFTKNESALLMLKDIDLNKQLFDVTFGFPGKHPVSDRDALIEELKTQGKWEGEDQIGNMNNETGIAASARTADKQNGESDTTQKSNSIPFISFFWVLAIVLGAVTCVRKMK